MIAVSVVAKRSISAVQLASQGRRRNQRAGCAAFAHVCYALAAAATAPAPASSCEAHVIGEAGAQAELRADTAIARRTLIRAQRRLQCGARIQLRQVGRIAKAGERLRQPGPATTDDQSGCVWPQRCRLARARRARSRIASPKERPPCAAARLHRSELVEHLVESFAIATSTQRPRTR